MQHRAALALANRGQGIGAATAAARLVNIGRKQNSEWIRKRAQARTGQPSPLRKLTEEQVRSIRTRRFPTLKWQIETSKRFKVSLSTIQCALYGYSYKEVAV